MSDTQPITLTDAAYKRVAQLIEEKGNPDLKLRIYIIGGGCAGFQYGFKFVETLEADDMSFTFQRAELGDQPVTMVVDTTSLMYLAGSTVDFKVSLKGAQFSIQNPQAETTCGCGSSFSLKLD